MNEKVGNVVARNGQPCVRPHPLEIMQAVKSAHTIWTFTSCLVVLLYCSRFMFCLGTPTLSIRDLRREERERVSNLVKKQSIQIQPTQSHASFSNSFLLLLSTNSSCTSSNVGNLHPSPSPLSPGNASQSSGTRSSPPLSKPSNASLSFLCS